MAAAMNYLKMQLQHMAILLHSVPGQSMPTQGALNHALLHHSAPTVNTWRKLQH